MLFALIAAAAAADCPDGAASSDDLVDAIEEGLLAFSDLDEDGFATAHNTAHTRLGCAGSELFAADVGAFHRLNAVHAFLADEHDMALGSFRASLFVQPDYQLRTAIAPSGGKLARLYDEAKAADPPGFEFVDMPAGFRLVINGKRGSDYPGDIPSVVQLSDADGLKWTGYMTAGEPLPTDLFGSADVAEPEPDPMPEPDPPSVTVAPEPLPTDPPPEGGSSGAKKGLAATALATGILGAGLFGGAAASRTQYEQVPTADVRQRTNAIYMASMGAGVVTLTLGAVSVVLP